MITVFVAIKSIKVNAAFCKHINQSNNLRATNFFHTPTDCMETLKQCKVRNCEKPADKFIPNVLRAERRICMPDILRADCRHCMPDVLLIDPDLWREQKEEADFESKEAKWVDFCKDLRYLYPELKGTSKNPARHAELVSASPLYQGIADHVRNDDCAKSVVFRSPLKFILTLSFKDYRTNKRTISDEIELPPNLISGYISKNSKPKIIRKAVEEAAKGRIFTYDEICDLVEKEEVPEWLDTMMREVIHTNHEDGFCKDKTDKLSQIIHDAENRHLKKIVIEYLIYKGYSNWKIAEMLNISGDEARLARAAFIHRLTETNSMIYALNTKGEIITLAGRDMELLVHIASGYLNKEIAAILNLNEETIKTLRRELIVKFGAKNTMSMIMYALRNGLIKMEDISEA